MDKLISLVGDIYQAAFAAELWPSVLERIADSAHATTTVFSVHDPTRRWGAIISGVRGDATWQPKYDQYYFHINAHLPKGTATLPTGVVGLGQIAIADEDLARTEYYNDFLKPQDLFHLAGGAIAREGSLEFLYTSYRSRAKGQFQTEELVPMQRLFPHLARAARISKELTVSGQVLQSFESLRLGLVLLDSKGGAVVTNAQANEIFNQNDGLTIGRQGQLATHRDSQQSLFASVAAAVGTSLGKGLENGGDLVINRPSGKKPYRLSVTPLKLSDFLSQFRQVAAAIFVTDPELDLPLNEELLKAQYRVTKTEAAVANLLAQGKDLNEVCAVLGIQMTTARTHLRGLMQKVGVKRQSELVLALVRMLGPVNAK